MFAYCGNNPVSRADTGGALFFTVLGTLVSGVFGAIDAAISYAQGEYTAQEAAASVLGSMASGFVTGLATDVLTITGGTLGVVVGTMAAAGAVGSIVGDVIETRITGEEIDANKVVEIAGNAAWSAASGALFAYIGFDPSKNLEMIKAGKLGKVITNYILNETGAEEVFEEFLSGACEFVAGFTRDIIFD